MSTSEPESGLERLRNLFGGGGKPPGPPGAHSEDDQEDDGMLRMSFLEHLEELRSRIIKIIIGVGVALGVSLTFCDPLWHFVVQPRCLRMGIHPPWPSTRPWKPST
jgi:hypothetical protein